MRAVRMGELERLQRKIRRCALCADHGYTIQGAPVLSGTAESRILLVGQAPGATEAETGRPFSGDAGRRLFGWLAEAGFSEQAFRKHQYLTSITRCYPGRHPGGRGDRVTTREEQKLCRAYLDAEIELISPEVILPVGRHAIRALLGSRPLNEVVGTVQRDAQGRWLVPLPHPSGASAWLNQPENRGHLQRALRHLARLRRRLRIPGA